MGQTNTEGRWFPVVLYSFSLNRNAKLRALLFFYFCSGVERCVGTNHRGEQFGGGLGVRKIWPGCYVDPTCPFIFFFFFSFFLSFFFRHSRIVDRSEYRSLQMRFVETKTQPRARIKHRSDRRFLPSLGASSERLFTA